jgi:hypothetical protein
MAWRVPAAPGKVFAMLESLLAVSGSLRTAPWQSRHCHEAQRAVVARLDKTSICFPAREAMKLSCRRPILLKGF